MKNRLLFVLYGPGWRLDLELKVPKDEEALEIELACEGLIKPQDKEHAFVWIQSCADVVLTKIEAKDPEEIYEFFRESLRLEIGN